MSRLTPLLALLALAGCDDEASAPPPDVEIFIDGLGVPHVYGVDDEAAFYGAGYVQASDRLYQMDMARRRAYGRQAEVLGAERLEDDKIARAFRWARHGRADAEAVRATQPETWAVLEAWVAGVNRRIDEVRAGAAPLDPGFETHDYAPEPWSPEDVMVIGKMTGFGNDLSLEFEIFASIAERLLPDAYEAVGLVRPIRDAYAVPPEERPATADACRPSRPGGFSVEPPGLDALAALRARFSPLRVMGSNNWAVAGEHTETGRPLIAGDPHQGFDFPGLFYALHINSRRHGGRFDVAGFSFVGVPGVSMGQTDRVMWVATTSFADVMDIWSVARVEGGVRWGDEVRAVTPRTETIRVRAEDGTVEDAEPMDFDYEDVEGGPLILPRELVPVPIAGAGRTLLFDWTGYRPRDGGGLLALNAARSVEDFEAAVDRTGSLNFNFLVADAERIGYRVGVQVPRRSVTETRRPWLVLDGDDPGTRWDGWLEPTQRPRGRGAERGFLVTANNDPFGFTADGRLDDDPWYYGALFAPGWRAAHIEATLAGLVERGGVRFDEMQGLQLDAHSGLADDLVPLLDAVTDPALRPLADRLLSWDRQMRRDSPEAALFHAFAHFVTEAAIGDDLSLLYAEAMKLQPVYILKLAAAALTGRAPDADRLLQEGRTALVETALARTQAWADDRFGDAPFSYADVRVTSFVDSFGAGTDAGEIATDGGESTVNVAPSRFYAEGTEVAERWVSSYGPVFRLLGRFAADGTPELHFNRPIGNRPGQIGPDDDWVEGRHARLPFTRAEVEAAAVHRFELDLPE